MSTNYENNSHKQQNIHNGQFMLATNPSINVRKTVQCLQAPMSQSQFNLLRFAISFCLIVKYLNNLDLYRKPLLELKFTLI